MVFICWFVFLDYVFLIKCFDYFSLFRNFRFMAYNQRSTHYEILDRGKRNVILACVISRIRGKFPSPTNDYTGFKEFVDFEV